MMAVVALMVDIALGASALAMTLSLRKFCNVLASRMDVQDQRLERVERHVGFVPPRVFDFES